MSNYVLILTPTAQPPRVVGRTSLRLLARVLRYNSGVTWNVFKWTGQETRELSEREKKDWQAYITPAKKVVT